MDDVVDEQGETHIMDDASLARFPLLAVVGMMLLGFFPSSRYAACISLSS